MRRSHPTRSTATVSELVSDRLHARTSECRMTSVSEIIREHDLATIDLLKIDAEKSELDILAGHQRRRLAANSADRDRGSRPHAREGQAG